MLSTLRERERGGSLVREKKSNKLKETKEKYNHINARGGFFFFF